MGQAGRSGFRTDRYCGTHCAAYGVLNVKGPLKCNLIPRGVEESEKVALEMDPQ